MLYSELFSNDEFQFVGNPETFVKIGRYRYRPLLKEEAPFPQWLSLSLDPEVIQIHTGWTTFVQLDTGDHFRFQQRATLPCKKTGYHTYTVLEGVPKHYMGENFFVFGDPLVTQ